MSREKFVKLRLSDEELGLLKLYAQSKGWNMSQAIRELIRQYCGH